jgi:hypothetical protein
MLRALFSDRYGIRSPFLLPLPSLLWLAGRSVPCLFARLFPHLSNSKQSFQSLHTFKPLPIMNQTSHAVYGPQKPQYARVALPHSVERLTQSGDVVPGDLAHPECELHVTCRSASCHVMTQYSDVGIRSMKRFPWYGIMRYTCPNLLLMLYYIGQKRQSTPCLRLGELPGYISEPVVRRFEQYSGFEDFPYGFTGISLACL